MGKKGKKTRWRRLPIGGGDEEGGLSLESSGSASAASTDPHRSVTFNEDEYTKITTPRQDVLFKKGYLGRKRPPNPSPSEAQEAHSGDSVESESYVSEEPQYAYPAAYMDPTGVYYVSGNTFETYDPYTGTVTVVVGPPAQYGNGTPVLAALPCQPVPLQPVEWFNPPAPTPAPWCYSYNRRKRYSTDSQNCSGQSSESPSSPQEPGDEGACAVYPPQYVYPGYMFGPPIYNMNGITVQGVIPQPMPLSPDLAASKRRKKRRRRRRGGVTDDGSESSCCEEATCDVPGSQSETSSDAGAGPNSDSGINTNSGSNSPPLTSNIHFECHQHQHQEVLLSDNQFEKEQPMAHILPLCSNKESIDECVSKGEEKSQSDVITPDEVSEELSTTEDDVTPNLCVVASEFSSQESTLSCVSTPSATKDLVINELEISSGDVFQEEIFESCQSVTEADSICESVSCDDLASQSVHITATECTTCDDKLNIFSKENAKENSEIITVNTQSVTTKEAEDVMENFDENVIDGNISKLQTSVIEPEAIKIIKAEESNVEEEEKIVEEDCPKIKVIEEPNESQHSTQRDSNFEVRVASEANNTDLRLLPPKDTLAPIPPPRRKRSMCRAADKVATRIVEEAIRKGVEEATCAKLRSQMSITEAVTRWLNSQSNSPLTCAASDSGSDDDDDFEDKEGLTDQKNVQGNPFPASSHSGLGQRVAKDCDSEWDLDVWDHSHTQEMCDPTRSVDKYYRLGAEDGLGDKVPPTVYKTAMHIHHSGPFPCGVCCIIQ